MSLIEEMDDNLLRACIGETRRLLALGDHWLAQAGRQSHLEALEAEATKRGLPTIA